MMKKYQIVFESEDVANAGSKAPSDIRKIANDLDFEELIVKLKFDSTSYLSKFKTKVGYRSKWKKIYNAIEPKSVILIQSPIYVKQMGRSRFLKKLKSEKNARLIFVVHDVEELRGAYNDPFQKEQFDEMLKLANVIIVHNAKMIDFFVKKGYPQDQLVNLEIFDYLVDADISNKSVRFSKEVTIAGNLDEQKTKYLQFLDKINTNFILYGPNFNLSSFKNIKYKGIVPAEKIPEILDKGFGLIWDGASIDTCNGDFGNYLKYNNPHKLSLYLVSGLPVFIWRKAAEARFICENNLGYQINSLNDIPNILEKITPEKYKNIANNVHSMSQKLAKGWFTKRAINESLRKLK